MADGTVAEVMVMVMEVADGTVADGTVADGTVAEVMVVEVADGTVAEVMVVEVVDMMVVVAAEVVEGKDQPVFLSKCY